MTKVHQCLCLLWAEQKNERWQPSELIQLKTKTTIRFDQFSQ